MATHTQTHMLSGKGTEDVTWAWQPLSSFSVTLPMEKPEHQPPEVVSGSFAKHLLDQTPEDRAGEEGSHRADTRRGPCQPPAPHLPQPQETTS